jgi:hypothetical protein
MAMYNSWNIISSCRLLRLLRFTFMPRVIRHCKTSQTTVTGTALAACNSGGVQ